MLKGRSFPACPKVNTHCSSPSGRRYPSFGCQYICVAHLEVLEQAYWKARFPVSCNRLVPLSSSSSLYGFEGLGDLYWPMAFMLRYKAYMVRSNTQGAPRWMKRCLTGAERKPLIRRPNVKRHRSWLCMLVAHGLHKPQPSQGYHHVQSQLCPSESERPERVKVWSDLKQDDIDFHLVRQLR